jgi:Type IV secretory pathway, VirD4 components
MLKDFRHRRALASTGLWRGNTPQAPIIPLTFSFREIIVSSIVLGIFAVILVYLISWLFNFHWHNLSKIAWAVGGCVTLLVLLMPYVAVIWGAVRYWRRPDFSVIRHFSFAQRTIANSVIALYLTLVTDWLYPWWLKIWDSKFLPTLSKFVPSLKLKLAAPSPLHHLAKHGHHHSINLAKSGHHLSWPPHTFFAIWLSLTFALGLIGYWLSRRPTTPKPAQRYCKSKALKSSTKLPFGLWVGEATGWLAKLSHLASMAANQQVALFRDDLAQNILILGAIGSGKTTRAVHPFLAQLLDQQCGGLIFDIKGDFQQAVAHFATMTQRHYDILGPGHLSFNLLAGLTPEIAASFLKSAFLLSGNRFDSFWVDTATELCRNSLGVLSFLPEHYTLCGLHRYLFDNVWQQERDQELSILSATLDEKQQHLLNTYQHYKSAVFDSFDEKVKAGVKATIAQILSPFAHPELIEAFCTDHTDNARLEEMLEGKVFLINLSLSRWGLGGKVAYMLIKLRFFNLMQSRATRPDWNQNRYVFFLCDEYQEIVSANKDGLSDLNFWDKSRSSRAIGIISAQSVSSFYAALGDRDLSQALLQNFRQKICFRTEDQNTIDMLNRLLGTVEVTRITQGSSGGATIGGGNNSSHRGTSTSYTTHDKPLLDGQFFRTLSSNYALVILSCYGMGFDDVLKMRACYV